jgi:hypothetical protein
LGTGSNGCACPAVLCPPSLPGLLPPTASHVGLMNRDVHASPNAGQQTSALTTSTSPPASHAPTPFHITFPLYQRCKTATYHLTLPCILHFASATSPPNHILAFAVIFMPPCSPRYTKGGDCGARIKESSTDQHTTVCILKQAPR